YYDMIILDEICIAIYYNLISLDEVVKVINLRNENTEIILTGRYAPQQLIDIADLVTEMKEIKHYYNSGIIARRGIEF
ncbi:MAG: cob(I)yrinic acid a,c-diamide adenosyltransferase, partial [Bacteroidales bacterium]